MTIEQIFEKLGLTTTEDKKAALEAIIDEIRNCSYDNGYELGWHSGYENGYNVGYGACQDYNHLNKIL